MSAITDTVVAAESFVLPDTQRRAIRYSLYVGYLALTAGIFHGLAQALSYAGVDILVACNIEKGTYITRYDKEPRDSYSDRT